MQFFPVLLTWVALLGLTQVYSYDGSDRSSLLSSRAGVHSSRSGLDSYRSSAYQKISAHSFAQRSLASTYQQKLSALRDGIEAIESTSALDSTTPVTCEELAATIQYLTSVLGLDPTGRIAKRNLDLAEEEYIEVCTDQLVCPLFHWDTYLFDVLTFEDFSAPHSDIEGMLMVGGDASLDGYSIGDKLGEDVTYSLIVQGDLSWHNGRLMKGSISFGGETDIGSTVLNGLYPDQHVQKSNNTVDWVAMEKFLLYVREYLKGFGGPASKGSYMLGKTYEVTCETLDKLNTLDINSGDGEFVVVNIEGEDCNLSNIGIRSLTGCENTVFNFLNAKTIHISEAVIPGTILAPDARITGSSGMVNGQVICKSFEGSTQFNHCPYTGCPAREF